MLDKKFADACISEELECMYDDKTLREFLSTYFDCGIEDDEISLAMDDEFTDTVQSWADDNDMNYDEMYDFIMDSLDNRVEYDIDIDMNYEGRPTKMGSARNPYWVREVCFDGRVLVNEISLELEEWFKEYKTNDRI